MAGKNFKTKKTTNQFYMEQNDEIITVGIFVRDIPALTKTPNGHITLPTLKYDGIKFNNFSSENGIPRKLYTITLEGEEKEYPQIQIEDKSSLYSASIAVNENGKCTFYNLEAYNDVAVYIHSEAKKGDEIFIIGKKSKDGQKILVDTVRVIKKYVSSNQKK